MSKEKKFTSLHAGRPKLRHNVHLGIDQSYTGFGLTALDEDQQHITWVYESSGKGVERLMGISDWLHWRLEEIYDQGCWIEDAAMEGYSYSSQMAHMLGELGGLTKMVLMSYGVQPWTIAPTALKKFATGKGTGVSKSQILLACFKKWGVEFSDDNAADAYVLARMSFHLSGKHPLSEASVAERDVLDRLLKDPEKYHA